MDSDFGSKYDQDDETRELVSTVELFPDMAQFEDRVSEAEQHKIPFTHWSLRKIGTLHSRLEFMQHKVSTRGGKLSKRNSPMDYSHRRITQLANVVFGFNGWSTSLIEFTTVEQDFDDTNSKYSAKITALVRVTLKDGLYREEYGIGDAYNFPQKSMCYSKCKKQAVTDATKRAILGFRNLLHDYETQMAAEEHVDE